MTDNTIGTRVRQTISRSASVNDSRRNQSRYTGDLGGLNEQATDISFTAPDTISSAGSGFPTFGVGANIVVNGAASNSRQFKVVTSSASTITVEPALVVNESAGALIDIRTV